jgi:hypothetical protein
MGEEPGQAECSSSSVLILSENGNVLVEAPSLNVNQLCGILESQALTAATSAGLVVPFRHRV